MAFFQRKNHRPSTQVGRKSANVRTWPKIFRKKKSANFGTWTVYVKLIQYKFVWYNSCLGWQWGRRSMSESFFGNFFRVIMDIQDVRGGQKKLIYVYMNMIGPLELEFWYVQVQNSNFCFSGHFCLT